MPMPVVPHPSLALLDTCRADTGKPSFRPNADPRPPPLIMLRSRLRWPPS